MKSTTKGTKLEGKTAVSPRFWIVCTRAGRRHYCTGERADQGRWTKFAHRARTFTAGEAEIAKGRSQAEIVAVAAMRKGEK